MILTTVTFTTVMFAVTKGTELSDALVQHHALLGRQHFGDIGEHGDQRLLLI